MGNVEAGVTGRIWDACAPPSTGGCDGLCECDKSVLVKKLSDVERGAACCELAKILRPASASINSLIDSPRPGHRRVAPLGTIASSPLPRLCKSRREKKKSAVFAHCSMLMEEPRRRHFFKVLVGDFARRIEIPQAFLCHIPEKGSRTSDTPVASSAEVILKNAEEKTWIVELEEIDGRKFLTTGWQKFVEDNCLGQGEFLVFKCDGNMHFVVLIFGLNAVEKEVWSSGSGARATGNLEGKLPCDISPASKRGHSGDKLTEAAKNLTHNHPQSVTLQSTQGDEHISSQDTIGFLDLHEVGCSQDELETHMPLKGPMDDDKAKAVAKVIRALNMDKLTVDLFCATLCLYKWNVDAAAQDFNVCRGKPQMPKQSLNQKLVSHFNFVKEQLRHFFPSDDNSSAPIHERRKNNLEEPNLSNQPPQRDLTPVKHKLVDGYESCDLSHQRKRRPGKLRRGSLQTPAPRRSPRLAHLNNTCINTDNILKERSEAPESLPVSANQVKDRADQSFFSS